MPQPLSNLSKVKNLNLSLSAAVYTARPKHMESVSKIITAAALSDQWMGNILVGLSPQNAVRLAHHLNSLENDAKKTASFEALAAVLLPEDMHDLLRLIVKKHRSASKLRNPFAHHRFGYTDDVEDLLLLVDPRHELIHRAQREELDANPPQNQEEKTVWFAARQKSAEEFEASIMTYDLAEMDRIQRDIQQATQCLTSFWTLTSRKPPAPIRDQILAQLNNNLRNPA